MVLLMHPTNSCNFSCRYCYLSEGTKTALNFMTVDFAKNVLHQVKDYLFQNKQQRIEILWHGGEPLLWGIENYEEILEFSKHEFCDFDYRTTMQTNLSLINERYIDLFLKYRVNLSFSIDGTKELHDDLRVTQNGEGTFDIIMNKVKLCREKGLHLGCIVVANRNHIGKIPELYKFMCDNKIGFKFNSLFNAGEAKKGISEFGLTPSEYAEIYIELFDLWFDDEKNKLHMSSFVDIAAGLISKKVTGCTLGQNCQEQFLAISPQGDVVPCGRFCDEELIKYSYGNLNTESLESILQKRKNTDAYNRHKYIEASSCKKCKFFDICHGGCLHDGYINGGNFKTKTFLCESYKKILTHISKKLKEAEML